MRASRKSALSVVAWFSCIAFLSGDASAAGELIHPQKNVQRSPTPGRHRPDCAERIDGLEKSNAEGEERLAGKNEVIEFCSRQYEQDATIQKLVDECAKYEEQPVLKQQFAAECMLAAFKYANALHDLRAQYKK